MTEGRRCESRTYQGDRCSAGASFWVHRMHRKSDAQDSCGRHLAETVRALYHDGTATPVVIEIITEESDGRA